MIMAKKDNAVYAPGELSRVREKLGVNDAEAKRMMQLLGGEVGTERNTARNAETEIRKNTAVSDKSGKRIRRADTMPDVVVNKPKPEFTGPFPGDDPSIQVKLSYRERVKIDQYSGQLIFEIKNSMQVLKSMLSFFKAPADFVYPRFVTLRMNEYFNKIEKMVHAARGLFPKSNIKRNNQLKRASPIVYRILETIRGWNVEALSKNIAELQAHPRAVTVPDFSDILRIIYKPLFVLEGIKIEEIKAAFRLIFKILFIESPTDAKEKYQDVIRNIIASLIDIRKNVHFGLYPMLMKLISDRFIDYERFFIERRRRFIAFLNISETEQLDAADLDIQQIESIDVKAIQDEMDEQDEGDKDEFDEAEDPGQALEDDINLIEEESFSELKEADNKIIEVKEVKEETVKTEHKPIEQGQIALGVLFPKAGWDKLEEFPDLYPYFAKMYSLRHGYDLIARSDPIQQIAILMHILDDLFIGLRYVHFGTITDSDGTPIRLSDELVVSINNWRSYIESSFLREYLPRLTEYCRLLENTKDQRSAFAKKSLNEIHWIKRLYFLPYYKFESLGPPPLQKNEIIAIYSEIRKLRRLLTPVVMGIEQGMRAGGAEAKAQCNGVGNPWNKYNFQVPNPVSRRMDMMFPPERKINATIIIFSLSVISVLDYIVNNENSWAYTDRPGPPFRSVKDEGLIPVFGVDTNIDTDHLFRESLKKAQHSGG